MFQSLTHLRGAWRIIVAKPRQVRRLLLPPFLLAMALKAWLSVQATGQVWPDLPPAAPVGPELAVRVALGLALAVMGLLWHRAIYFGARAPLSPKLALRYWGQGAALSALAAIPFLPLVLGWVPRQAVFAADAVSLSLVLCFGIVVARAAGGERLALRAVWSPAQAGAASVLAVLLALALLAQSAAVSALAALHSGAAFLLDGAITFALIVTVLTLMSRPGS
ncbi:hypothetical protein ROE7235_00496 [Roseibaca ekhonensis]|jgi:hypothetical protein|uniref:Uncharacterized protein n=1 Tax=Roseinatronobacter ekhonensis TaxID=254356 RepID=A0A3B0M5P9_9RHOB|nr:hypothetical protein [Roseibaca ekhonensis]SUZ30770.1 hypothetical protein ROE7235_00496 [Roseibaca ekhonensis]